MSKFNALAFIGTFDGTLTRLQRVENISKEVLKDVSRGLLFLLHGNDEAQKAGDIGFINRTLNVLSPVNRRVAAEFFKEFTGFIYDADRKQFTKKSKKHYDEVQAKTLDKLTHDPVFNIWTWQELRLTIEKTATPYTMERVQETLTQMVKKADKVNISKRDILGVMLNTGFTIQDIIDCLESTNHLGEAVGMIEEQFQEIQ